MAEASARRRRYSPLAGVFLSLGVVLGLVALHRRLPVSQAWLSSPSDIGRRAALRHGAAAAGLLLSPALPAFAEEPLTVPPGSVPAGLIAEAVGKKVTTPNGLEYEPLELGESGKSLRDGPPRSGSVVWVKYAAHLDSFAGPVVDSSAFRGGRKPNPTDYIEIRLNLEPTITNGMFEALKLMKVGGKGRFVQPPKLSYGGGDQAFDSDELTPGGSRKVQPGTTLYYDVELVRIIKP
eukprot:TRINITY_DN48648_c0_g1_i1.p1 TRINITY_DN48648_c0_g1~~TRINITY_DN48648_c0_g1_i1.p1  ORF type:complete len:248 (+),score=33.26 TRINITY_DN48648_c0_g1_i1:39-746(+)